MKNNCEEKIKLCLFLVEKKLVCGLQIILRIYIDIFITPMTSGLIKTLFCNNLRMIEKQIIYINNNKKYVIRCQNEIKICYIEFF